MFLSRSQTNSSDVRWIWSYPLSYKLDITHVVIISVCHCGVCVGVRLIMYVFGLVFLKIFLQDDGQLLTFSTN